MIVRLLTEHHLKFLSLKGGCIGSSESTLDKMSNFGNLMQRLNFVLSIMFQIGKVKLCLYVNRRHMENAIVGPKFHQ